MIDKGITSGKYIETIDKAHVYSKYFQYLLYRIFKNKKYAECLVSKQSPFFLLLLRHKFKTTQSIEASSNN